MKFLHILLATSFLASGVALASEIPFPDQKKLDNKKVVHENKIVSLKELGPRPGFAGYYLAARHAQADQDWHAANHYFDIVSRKDPINIDMKRRSMVIAMGAGDLETAAKHAQNIVRKTPGDSLGSLFLSAKAFQAEDYKEALKQLKSMESGGMSSFAAPVLKSWTKAALGQFDISDLQLQPLDAFHVALIGQLLNKKEDSLSFLEKVLRATQDEPSLKLADAFLVLGEDKKAKDLYLALQKLENSSSLSARLTYLAKKNKKYKPSFLKAISSSEGISTAYIDMAKILYAQNSSDSARIFAHIGLNLSKDIEDAHILLAKIYSQTGQFNHAIYHYKQIDPKSRYATEVQLKISEIKESLGQKESAISGLKVQHEKSPNTDLVIQLGDIERRSENYRNAIIHYDEAINSFEEEVPDDYWYLYYVRGMSHERVGQWDLAETDFEKALEYRPNDPFVLNYLAYGWAERDKNLTKALEYLERAVSRRPTDGHIRDSLGWAFYKLGQYEQAIEPLEKAITYLPYDPVINEHLGDAYWQVGRKREALFQWQRALNHVDESDVTVDIQRLRDKLVSGLPDLNRVMAAENKIVE